jgi:23S rRNA U2552 (ribose-2'-O)-methylase RlmE/FtsJ
MTFFLLPKLSNKLTSAMIELQIADEEKEIYGLSKSLKYYLNSMKKKIDDINNEWDIYKKYTNPFEYIHSVISNQQKISISKLKPLSRSFYKMIEIYNLFSFADDFSGNISTFHLAEGPGGFIEAFTFLRKNTNDNIYGMTLISEDQNIPSWKKSKLFLQKHNNITIETGEDKTGNLMSKNNLLYCLNKYRNKMEIITADGGFDFSIDFNKQEEYSIPLIFCQISFALAIQKYKGSFVLKMFDLFSYASLDLLFILSSVYEKVYIVKPNTSRFANSEKYIICKKFKLENSTELVLKLSDFFDNFNNPNLYIKRFLNIKIPYIYKSRLEELNAIFGQQQIENINLTFNLIDQNNSEKLELYKRNNINKCITWCQKFNIPCNKHLLVSNIYDEYSEQSSTINL